MWSNYKKQNKVIKSSTSYAVHIYDHLLLVMENSEADLVLLSSLVQFLETILIWSKWVWHLVGSINCMPLCQFWQLLRSWHKKNYKNIGSRWFNSFKIQTYQLYIICTQPSHQLFSNCTLFEKCISLTWDDFPCKNKRAALGKHMIDKLLNCWEESTSCCSVELSSS